MARIVGMETEFALGFTPAHPGGPRPDQEAIFQAILRALQRRYSSCDALYYKGGSFLQNGSLIHFEVSRLDDLSVGLLEWATPECLGAREAAGYAKAQELALAAVAEEAEVSLGERGFPGRIRILKNNEDRAGNAYGCHESYDVAERARPFRSRVFARLFHPLNLLLLLLLSLAVALPVVLGLGCLGLAYLAFHLVGIVPGLGWLGRRGQGALRFVLEYLLEVGPRPGSGGIARLSLVCLRVGGRIFSWTGREVLFSGHLPAFLPFLVTRCAVAGAGTLTADGRYLLSPRARIATRAVAAFIYGKTRPLIDVKEYFYRRPLSFRRPRKRLHLLAGDANRSEYAELLKLATTELVLDALEAGALDRLAARLQLLGGPVRAFRRAARDPGLATPVARDRESGELLTALDVQRRYLEAVWEHLRTQEQVDPASKDALVRWSFVLDSLGEQPRSLDRELDWVIKLRLLDAALGESLPGVPQEAAWEGLRAWGPVNALLEARAGRSGALALDSADDEAMRAALPAALGWWGWLRARLAARRGGLDWASFPAHRRAYLRLKTIDLGYHEVSGRGGYYDWLREAGAIAQVLDPVELARAMAAPPRRTRATIRGETVLRAGRSAQQIRVGWDKIEIKQQGEARTFRLDDPYRHQAPELEDELG